MEDQPRGLPSGTEASALAELALCENLSQTSGWAARWSAQVSGADAALLWAPDTVHPLFLCIGAYGSGAKNFLKRSVPRETGIVHDLVRDRVAIPLDRKDFATPDDPWLEGLPDSIQACLAVPLEAEGFVVGLLALLFRERPRADATLARLEGFLRQAAPALGRALRAERKTVGMLHAIERLTNLYDLSKAFGSTIEWEELTALIIRKAVDFGAAEAGSFWVLEGDEVALAATAVNENYEVPNAPAAIGSTVVADVLADQTLLRRNSIPPEDPAAQENPDYPIRSLLAVPLVEEEVPVGALVLANKRGRHPEFSAEDEELLQDLARQAVRALRVARQYEAEKKVEELDALLAVSREITATLDLDKVMKTIVNATSALVEYDRCAIAIQDRGRLRLGAVSGTSEIDRKDPETRRTEELLAWVFLGGSDISITLEDDGRLEADRPETEEKFRAFFQESGLRSFYAVLLKDEEGKLGVLSFESKEPLLFDEDTRDLVSILVNQATVAVRNAQLYQQVPLSGFWKPLLEKRKKLLDIPRRRRQAWGIGALAVLVVLFAVPWRLRIAGPARVLPGRRAAVTAGVDGIVKGVLHREGDRVEAGEIIATLKDESFQADLAESRAALEIAQSEMARHQEAGNAAGMFEAQSRRDELLARIALAEERLARTRLAAPSAGVIVTPRIEERVGQFLPRGGEFCVVADVGTVTVEVAVPEEDASLVRPEEPATVKLNPYPTRTFQGSVTRVGAQIREEAKERFVIAEVRIGNADGLLKTGMLGRAKISAGHRQIATLLLRKPARYLYAKLWPLLP
ncbi:MAG: efflux RND transporter periplasmic adaptor subunit [Thermoanaerobaculia bacterium]